MTGIHYDEELRTTRILLLEFFLLLDGVIE
jgi:hypothetical protein